MPTNRENNLSRTKVEQSKGSKEFMLDDPEMTVELAHAVHLLDEHFKKQGYDEWILGPVCSRKLLEKFKDRLSEQQRILNPAPEQNADQTDAVTYLRRLQEQLARTTLQQWVVDPQPMTPIQEGPVPGTMGVWTGGTMPIEPTQHDVATVDYLEHRRHQRMNPAPQPEQHPDNGGTIGQGTSAVGRDNQPDETPF